MSLKDVIAELKADLKGVEGITDEVFGKFDAAIATAEQFSGLDPQRARDAIAQTANRAQVDQRLQTLGTERDQLTTTINQTEAALLNTRKELAAVRSLNSAGVREGYEDLLLPKIANSLEVGEDGAVSVPEGLISGFKDKYAEMFHAVDAAGTGGQVTGGAAPAPGPKQVSVGSERMITGVNPADVLSGEVVFTDS